MLIKVRRANLTHRPDNVSLVPGSPSPLPKRAFGRRAAVVSFTCRAAPALPGLLMLGALVRSEKTCVSEGESPSSLEARLPEFGTKVMNGKV